MTRHALAVLEFPQVMEDVARRAQSELGRARVMKLTPVTDAAAIQEELYRVDELARFLDRHRDWAPPSVPDAGGAFRRLSLEGSVLEPRELYRVGSLLTSSRELKDALSRASSELGSLEDLGASLTEDRRREKTISRIVDAEGAVLDTASRDLARIRNRLRNLENRVVRSLERLLGTLPERIVVPDASVTIREGRYVIPVRREGRTEVGGVVLDESATGGTLYVEPPLAQEMMAELRDLRREESREVQRILREQSDSLRPIRSRLEASQEALVAFDSLWARSKTALAWGGAAPRILPSGSEDLEIVHGRHPLLLAHGDSQVVPFHLRLEAGERVLVVSGPNTGGKSVFLKALGLVATLAQSGVIPPVGEGTRLPLFTRVFADIGDEQSISESLSTFSAHLENLKRIVADADPHSLVLVDEMGTGTDPQEGAALARTILEHLVERGALTVVTSHLGALKKLDTPGSGMVNASLQFDPDRIEPTFHLVKGRPGRSYGLAIARRLGFPPELLDRAEDLIPREEARMEELLATLEGKEKEASELLRKLSRDQARTQGLKEGLERRERELRERERTARTRAQEEARQLLLDARQEVEAAIQEVRSARDRVPAGSDLLDEVDRGARRRVEDAVRRHSPETGKPPVPGELGDLKTGDRVSIRGSGSKGRILEIREGRASVETAGVRIDVPTEELEFVSSSEQEPVDSRQRASAAASSWQGPEAEPETEVDLRGLRVADIAAYLDRALDQAVLGGLNELRIIHGKGTGALRQAVAELLEEDGRVGDFRMGSPGEGGAGVTMVRLR